MTATLTRLAFRVEPAPFAKAVAWAASRVPPKASTPQLSCVLLRVHDDTLTVSGFDGEVCASATLDVPGAQDGATLVSARLVGLLAKSFTKPLNVALDADRLVIKSDGTFRLPTMFIEDYPTLPDLPQPLGSVVAETFAHAVARTGVATVPDATPEVLRGMMLCLGERLRFIASDKYRVGVAEIGWQPVLDSSDVDVLLPSEVITKAAPMLASSGHDITIAANAHLVGFSTPTFSLVARLIVADARHRWLAEHLPEPSEAPLRISVAAFGKALDRARLIHEVSTPITLDVRPDEVHVAAVAADTSDGDEPVACEYAGEPLTIKVNPDYLLDALKACGGDEVSLHFGVDAKKPFLILPDANDGYQHLMMPIRPGIVP